MIPSVILIDWHGEIWHYTCFILLSWGWVATLIVGSIKGTYSFYSGKLAIYMTKEYGHVAVIISYELKHQLCDHIMMC